MNVRPRAVDTQVQQAREALQERYFADAQCFFPLNACHVDGVQPRQPIGLSYPIPSASCYLRGQQGA